MHEDFLALIKALVENEKFRESFLGAKDRATRLRLAAEQGLNVPSERDIAAVHEALADDGEVPPGQHLAGFWMGA